jgi:ribokinase
MTILNFGSINIDHVFFVEHFVRPGETLLSMDYRRFSGGKGYNQSIALAQAGAEVFHAGKIGHDGVWLLDRMELYGVDTSFVQTVDTPTGQAIIQVNREGENAIILFGGANRDITNEDAVKVLSEFKSGDYLLLQNEISAMQGIMKLAAEKGLRIILNPAPMSPEIQKYPLDTVGIFIMNEIEGRDLTGEAEFGKICRAMINSFPKAMTILTVGDQGAWFAESDRLLHVNAEKVKPVDTTAAGDTFIGYFIAEYSRGNDLESALGFACRAAAICVTRPGAADSIPKREEVSQLGG